MSHTALDPLVSEFASVEEECDYLRWLQAKVNASLNDSRPSECMTKQSHKSRKRVGKKVLMVNWRPQAISDLIDIIDYIEKNNPQIVQYMETLIRTATLDLAVMPHIGRPGRITGTRERFVLPNYFIVYRVNKGGVSNHGVSKKRSVEILNMVHAYQQFPPRER